jgi:DNA-binding transcriptional MerR regulator
MSVLASLSGVPAATIKHYLREGLLPRPEVKTGRNMAFYDASLVERIQRIKALQREHFLPLRHIKSVLEGRPAKDDDAEATAAIERALASMSPNDTRTRAQLVASGMPARELALFESMGIVTPVTVAGVDTFTGDDLSLLRLHGTARRSGITPKMLPASIIGPYVQAIQELVRVELEMFRQGVIPHAGPDLANLTDVATRMSEQLVVLIRRKMLLPTLRTLLENQAAPTKARRPASRRKPQAIT